MIVKDLKKDYLKKTEIRLKKIRTQITIIERRAGKAEADIRVRYDQQLDQVRGQYVQAKDNLEKLRNARPEAWVDQETELERSIDTLSEAVSGMAHQISV